MQGRETPEEARRRIFGEGGQPRRVPDVGMDADERRRTVDPGRGPRTGEDRPAPRRKEAGPAAPRARKSRDRLGPIRAIGRLGRRRRESEQSRPPAPVARAASAPPATVESPRAAAAEPEVAPVPEEVAAPEPAEAAPVPEEVAAPEPPEPAVSPHSVPDDPVVSPPPAAEEQVASVPPPWRGEPVTSPLATWRSPDPGGASVGELVKQLSEQASTLARQELRLAQLELQEKGKKAGIGVGVFGVAGIAAFFGVAALLAAIVLALDSDLKGWAAAGIVGVGLLAFAGVAALIGKKQIGQAAPPAPERAIGSVKRDVDTVEASARR